jgi:nucleoside-diphosphate-sugar epimerase
MEIMTKARKVRVLVRGATGFPGRKVLKALLAHPEVAPIARLPSA